MTNEQAIKKNAKFKEALDQIIGYGQHAIATKQAILKAMDEFGYHLPKHLEEITTETVESMSHFGVIRDWVIRFKTGEEIEVSASIIKVIVEHESKELGYRLPAERKELREEVHRIILPLCADYRKRERAIARLLALIRPVELGEESRGKRTQVFHDASEVTGIWDRGEDKPSPCRVKGANKRDS